MNKKIITGDEAIEQLLEGAKLLYDAVSTTLGPKGHNAVIEAFGEPIVTHDGVTVAKAIDSVVDASSGARVGIEMIKASSSKTNDNVGDGTTSSTILTYHLMNGGRELLKKGINGMTLRRELEQASKEALAELDKLATPITTEKATIEIATISSENSDIGKAVGHMYHVLGKDAMVAVEIGTKVETEYEIVEGYTLDRGLLSPHMVTDARTETASLEKPTILVTGQKLGLKDISTLLGETYDNGNDSIVIICDDFKQDLLDHAVRLGDEFKIVGIKAPGFGDQRLELLKDVAAFSGTKVWDGNNSLTPADLGRVDKLVANSEEVIITGGTDVTEYVKDLQAKLKTTKSEFDRKKIEKRVAALHAKVGEIRVGGNTEMEADERKMLIDDAVAATEAALKDGIVPGGGTTYIELARRLDGLSEGHKLLKEALQTPFRVLMANAGERSGMKLTQLTENEDWYGKGFDVMGDGTLVDLKEHGVIDPVMVIKQAITNAVSVAGSALTTGVIITNEKEKQDGKEEE